MEHLFWKNLNVMYQSVGYVLPLIINVDKGNDDFEKLV